ncbi:MAG: amidase [Pseudomonadota bacterium]
MTTVDDLGALRLRLDLHGAADGPLAGLTFAVKDMFDVEGLVTGGGNPDWLATHEPAISTASSVKACLDAGAHLIGIAIADELAFSPFGENVHYGTPLNSAAPDRVPGGSSSGSASATAGGLVDFALGTDTAGSVRIPASYCGVYGFRPTYGRVPIDGVLPLSPSFDTVGWFARDADLLARVGDVLLEAVDAARPIRRLLWLDDAFELADDSVRPSLEAAARRVEAALVPAEHTVLDEGRYADWLAAYNALRPPEVWATFGDWIKSTKPHFGSRTAKRFANVERVATADTTDARRLRANVEAQVADLLGDDTVLMLPTVPTIAPKKGHDDATAAALRENTFRLSCLAPLLGMPEVTLPLATADGAPIGLSLLGPADGDRMLLDAAQRVAMAQ